VVMSLPTSRSPSATSTAPDAVRGKELYVQVCAGCHGLEGDKISDKNLKTVKSRMSAQQLAAFIVTPAGAMPKIFPTPRTSEDERDIRDVAAFVAGWR
jgi:mono/diheme cytochrome c family protein